MSLSPRPAADAVPAFEATVDAALTRRAAPRVAAQAALAQGVDLRAVVRYAAGAASPAERRAAEAAIGRTAFAAQAAGALVRGARGTGGGGLAAGVLEAARQGPVDAGREVGRAALRAAGRADLVDARPAATPPEPALAVAAALAHGRWADARAAASATPTTTPDPRATTLTTLAARVAGLEDDPDLALGEVLAWLCEGERE